MSKEVILVLIHAYSHEIGSERVLELFDANKAFDLKFCYLKSVVEGSTVRMTLYAPALVILAPRLVFG